MTSAMTITAQHLSISTVRSIVVTEIVAAEEGFARAVRFFGEPVVNSAPLLILEVTLTASDKASLEVSTPVLQF